MNTKNTVFSQSSQQQQFESKVQQSHIPKSSFQSFSSQTFGTLSHSNPADSDYKFKVDSLQSQSTYKFEPKTSSIQSTEIKKSSFTNQPMFTMSMSKTQEIRSPPQTASKDFSKNLISPEAQKIIDEQKQIDKIKYSQQKSSTLTSVSIQQNQLPKNYQIVNATQKTTYTPQYVEIQPQQQIQYKQYQPIQQKQQQVQYYEIVQVPTQPQVTQPIVKPIQYSDYQQQLEQQFKQYQYNTEILNQQQQQIPSQQYIIINQTPVRSQQSQVVYTQSSPSSPMRQTQIVPSISVVNQEPSILQTQQTPPKFQYKPYSLKEMQMQKQKEEEKIKLIKKQQAQQVQQQVQLQNIRNVSDQLQFMQSQPSPPPSPPSYQSQLIPQPKIQQQFLPTYQSQYQPKLQPYKSKNSPKTKVESPKYQQQLLQNNKQFVYQPIQSQYLGQKMTNYINKQIENKGEAFIQKLLKYKLLKQFTGENENSIKDPSFWKQNIEPYKNFKYTDCSDVAHMWVAVMSFPTTPDIINKFSEISYKYANAKYNEEVTKSTLDNIQHHLKTQFQYFVDKADIYLTYNVNNSFSYGLQILTKENDGVIFCVPMYHMLTHLAHDLNREIIEIDFIKQNGKLKINFQEIENQFKNPKNKVIVVVNPANPTGQKWKWEDLSKLADLCEQYKKYIISDEIFADLKFDLKKKHICTATVSDYMRQNTITCQSVSKAYNVSGLSGSYCIIHNKVWKNEFAKHKYKVGAQNPGIFGLTAIDQAFSNNQDWINTVVELFKQNYQFMKKQFEQKLPNVVIYDQEAAYLTLLDYSNLNITKEQLYQALEESKIVINELSNFYHPERKDTQEIRINIALPKEQCQDAISRFVNSLQNIYYQNEKEKNELKKSDKKSDEKSEKLQSKIEIEEIEESEDNRLQREAQELIIQVEKDLGLSPHNFNKNESTEKKKSTTQTPKQQSNKKSDRNSSLKKRSQPKQQIQKDPTNSPFKNYQYPYNVTGQQFMNQQNNQYNALLRQNSLPGLKISNDKNMNQLLENKYLCSSIDASYKGIPMQNIQISQEMDNNLCEILDDFSQIGYFGYPNFFYQPLYTSIKNYLMDKFNYCVKNEEIALSANVFNSFAQCLNFLVDEGEGQGKEVVGTELKIQDNRYVLDFDDIELKLQDTNNKVFVLVNPHNPTGRIWESDELHELLYLCQKYNKPVISYEAQCEFILNANEFIEGRHTVTAIASPEYKQNIITIMHPLELFNVSAIQISFLVIHNEEWKKQYSQLQFKNAIMFPELHGQLALKTICENENFDWQNNIKKQIISNYKYLIDTIEYYLPELQVLRQEAGYICLINYEKIENFAFEQLQQCDFSKIVIDSLELMYYPPKQTKELIINLLLSEIEFQNVILKLILFMKSKQPNNIQKQEEEN